MGSQQIIRKRCLGSSRLDVLSYKPRQDIRSRLGLVGKRVIFSVGRLDPRKRIGLLIRAYAKLLPYHNDLHLLIGGIGEEKESLEILVKELGIGDRVTFLGLIPDSELFDYYSACDVFAFPSWTTSGITPYEALAVGKKVVWTTEADEPILNDEHVFLADPTVDDFTRGLEKALKSNINEKPDLSNYTWDNYFGTILAALNDLKW
jgi:glycosyltransferase involved in cell wall biosynthesis